MDVLRATKRPGMEDLIGWLLNTDFFTAPASTKYHLSYEGGLAEHISMVFGQLIGINEEFDLKIPKDSLAIMALLHDVCKVNCYVRETKRARVNGEWVDQEGYSFVDNMPLGHGEKSVILIQQYIKLTVPEMLAIRWHMGPYEATTYSQMRDLNNAMSGEHGKYVKALQYADLGSTWFIEK